MTADFATEKMAWSPLALASSSIIAKKQNKGER
jgi:hypothetical protein